MVADNRETDNAKLERMIRALATEVSGVPGNWVFTVEDNPLICLTSEAFGRMRVIAPVVDATELDRDALYKLMAANFDKALDAKYAIWQDQLWSTFVHPLPPLTETQFRDAVAQVISLTRTYGTTFSSGDVHFGEDVEDRPPLPGEAS